MNPPRKKSADALTLIDIHISTFNKEDMIERVLRGIFQNTTTPFNLILVFDGCTDRTKPLTLALIESERPPLLRSVRTVDTPNIFENRSNNVGFKMATERYLITLQDDVIIEEKGWERRLTFPLRVYDDVFAVTGRTALNVLVPESGPSIPSFVDKAGREFFSHPRRAFMLRSVINRGPIAFKNEVLKTMGYLDESFAPGQLDDADLCLRTYDTLGLRCGAFWIGFHSDESWGSSRNQDKNDPNAVNWPEIERRNAGTLRLRYPKFTSGTMRPVETRIITDNEIDYAERDPIVMRTYKRVRRDLGYVLWHIRRKITAARIRFKV